MVERKHARRTCGGKIVEFTKREDYDYMATFYKFAMLDIRQLDTAIKQLQTGRGFSKEALDLCGSNELIGVLVNNIKHEMENIEDCYKDSLIAPTDEQCEVEMLTEAEAAARGLYEGSGQSTEAEAAD